MPVVRITDRYNISGNVVENTFHYFHATRIPTASDVNALLADFETKYLSKVKDIQTDETTHTELLGYAYNLGYSLSRAVNVVGTVAVGGDLTVSSNLAAIIRRNLGDTTLNSNGGAYTGNRPLRRSLFYLGGLPESFMHADGFDVPAALSAAYEAFKDALEAGTTTLSANGFTWYHNAFGFALEATDPSPSFPTGKPARPDVVAPVLSLSGTGFTRLKSRKV
jgi:hypothetical protein